IMAGPCGLGATPLAEIVDAAPRREWLRALPPPPLMHGTALWYALTAWANGGTIVINDEVRQFNAAEVLQVCATERVASLAIVGDAFARRLLDELNGGRKPPADLRILFS